MEKCIRYSLRKPMQTPSLQKALTEKQHMISHYRQHYLYIDHERIIQILFFVLL